MRRTSANQANAHTSPTLDDLAEAVLIIGEDGAIVAANAAAAHLFGMALEDLVGLPHTAPELGLTTEVGSPIGEPEEDSTAGDEPEGRLIVHHDGIRTLVHVRPADVDPRAHGGTTALSMSEVDDTQDLKREIDLLAKENTRLRWSLRDQVQLLGAIAQLGSLMTSTESPEEILRQVAEYGQIAFDVDAVLVLGTEAGADFLPVTAASEGLGLDEAVGLPRALSQELGLEKPAPFLACDLQPLSGPHLFGALLEEGMRQAVSIPLLSESGLHGILVLADRVGVPSGRRDLAALSLFAVQASTALMNAYQLQATREVSLRLQSAVLSIPVKNSYVRSGHVYRSAADLVLVGGDFYDLFDLPDGRVAAVIGDVSGKGLDAAVLTLLVRHTLRAYAYEYASPSEVLARTNDLMVELYPRRGFVTVCYCTIDPSTGALTYSTGGHPPPVLARRAGELQILEANGLALGALPDADFAENEDHLGVQDVLLFYTDGLTEARVEGGFLGEEGLLELLGEVGTDEVEKLPDRLLEALERRMKGDSRDDMAILALGL